MKNFSTIFISLSVLFLSFGCSNDTLGIVIPEKNIDIQVVKTFGGSHNESARSVVKTLDGGYAVLGFTQSIDGDIPTTKSTVQYDLWLLKFDAQDNLVWQKTIGGTKDDYGYKIIQSNDGGYAIVGSSKSNDIDQSTNFGFEDVWVQKLDASGSYEWKSTLGFSGSDIGYSIIQTTDGGYFVGSVLDVSASGGLGNSKNLNWKHAGGDYWGIKLSKTGSTEWRKYFGGTNTDTCYDVVEATDGFIMIGSSDSNDVDIKNSKGSYDFWIVKTDKQGKMIWEKSFGGSEIDEAFQVLKTTDNNFLIVGETRSSDQHVTNQKGGADIWVVKMDTNGAILWQKNYGGTNFDVGRGVSLAQDGGFYITGSTRSMDGDVTENKGSNDVWLLKIDATGNLEWQKTIGGSDIDFSYDVVELDDKSLILVGETNSKDKEIPSNKGFSDALIIKMR
jgi:hypothetical protein